MGWLAYSRRGGVPVCLSNWFWVVGGLGFEDGEDDVAAAAGDGGEGGAVGFALLAFGLVVAFGVWVVLDGDEGGLVHGVFEAVVASSVVGGGVEGAAGAAVGGGESGVGGEFGSVGEAVGVADFG